MFFPWFAATMLALEAQKVIEMRLVRIAWGGDEARAEMSSMVAEKIDAAIEATGMMMAGCSSTQIVARVREHVAANTLRLSA